MKIENKTPIAEEIIRNNPTGYGLFAGIGDNFNSVAQVICELMDDAVSNLRANSGKPVPRGQGTLFHGYIRTGQAHEGAFLFRYG